MFARSMAWSGSSEALARLERALAREVAPACRAIHGHGWITAVRMDGESALTITSFWQQESDVAPDGIGTRQLASLSSVDGCSQVSTNKYDVRLVRRTGPTLSGYLVSAASFPYDANHEQDVLRWATDVAEMAESLTGFNFAVVELADGPRLISVTTWRHRDAFTAVESKLLAAYQQAPSAVSGGERQWRRGSVVYSSSRSSTSPEVAR